MPASAEPYRSPLWLPGGNAQTIYAATLAPRPVVHYRRERWDTPDGDFIDLDWIDGASDAPLLVLFHGLEGDSRGHYALSLMAAVRRLGWRGVVVHFRGCSGEMNRLPRAYHSGDAAEIDWILRRLKGATPDTPLYAMGVSLGGNALLKWLGEQGDAAKPVLQAAVAVSAPVDLHAAGRALDRGFNLIYTRRFLATLRRKALDKLAHHPGICDAAAIRGAATLHRFDHVFTAPLHGYTSADDYWTRASSKPWLAHIRVPTLLLNARNDPFLPASALPSQREVAADVLLEFPAHGGHVGFVTGPFPGNLAWLPSRVLAFLDRQR